MTSTSLLFVLHTFFHLNIYVLLCLNKMNCNKPKNVKFITTILDNYYLNRYHFKRFSLKELYLKTDIVYNHI